MSLVFIVYLIGVLPSIKGLFSSLAIFGTLLLLFASVLLKVEANSTASYSWEDQNALKQKRTKFDKWGNWTLKGCMGALLFGLIAGLIPSERTMYTMITVYGAEKLVENPQVQQLGSDGVDVLKELLARAKRELASDQDVTKGGPK